MEEKVNKSMNKQWKESGTTLSFKDYVDRENKKNESDGNFLKFTSNPTDIIDQTINTATTADLSMAGLKTTANPNLVLGLNKNVVIISAILIIGATGYYLYKKYGKK